MINWILENLPTIIVGVIVAAALLGVCAKMISDKKNHKSSCGCGCSGCGMKDMCHK